MMGRNVLGSQRMITIEGKGTHVYTQGLGMTQQRGQSQGKTGDHAAMCCMVLR